MPDSTPIALASTAPGCSKTLGFQDIWPQGKGAPCWRLHLKQCAVKLTVEPCSSVLQGPGTQRGSTQDRCTGQVVLSPPMRHWGKMGAGIPLPSPDPSTHHMQLTAHEAGPLASCTVPLSLLGQMQDHTSLEGIACTAGLTWLGGHVSKAPRMLGVWGYC